MRSTRPLFVLACLLGTLILLTPAGLRAQTANVSGTVTDPSGSAVPDVNVTVRNTQTSASRTAQTSDTGFYRITALVPAVYEIVFEKGGFRILRYSNVVLTVDQSLTLDVKLEVSPIAQTVEVSGQGIAPIELEDAQISNVVDARRMTDLPLILRDPYELVLLSPGTSLSGTRLGGFAVNGQSEKHNNFLLDGVDNNDTEVPGIAGGITSLNPDSTQEFRLISNSYLPEFGRNAGAIVDIITKSGTNELRGNAYWFGRYAALGARDFFDQAPRSKDPYVRNTFGASAGGPLIKDKTFWFGNYEGARFVTTLTNTSTVPTAAFKSGLFTFGGNTVDLRSPSSPNNATASSFGTPLPLDTATIAKILALYPAPNGTAVDDVRGHLNFASPSRSNADDFTIKIDHNFNRNNTLAVRYVFNRFKDPNPFHLDFLPGGLGAIGTYQRTQNVSIALTSTLGTSAVNELRVGGNRTNLQFTCGPLSTLDSFGVKDPLGHGNDFALPNVASFGCGGLSDANGQARFTGTYTYKDNISKVVGRHTVKGGIEFRPVYSNGFNDFVSRTVYAFNDLTIFDIPSINLNPALGPCDPNNTATFAALCGSRVLQDMGWMLFGAVSTQQQNQFFNKLGTRTGDDLRGFRQREFGVYLQDSFKVASNLTLDYGVRWEYYGVPFEVNNNFSNLFADPSGTPPFTFSIVGRSPALRGLYNRQWTNIEPRVGFAWDPFKKGKTSVRGGYGIFHDRTYGNLLGNSRANPPFQQALFLGIGDVLANAPPPATVTTTATLNNGDLGGPFPIFDLLFKSPNVQTWNLGVQHQLVGNLIVEVNYVGQHGTRLIRDVDGNPPQPAKVAALLAAGVSPSRLQGSIMRFPGSLQAVNNTALFEPLVNKTIGSSVYHGLQLKVTKRFSHGFEIQGAYTYAHSIDNSPDPIDTTLGNRNLPRNSFNLGPERGNSDFDVRQRLVINYIYEFPFGRGRARLTEGFLGRLLEGWQIAGITIISGGIPFDVFGNRDDQHTGLTDRVDLIGDPSIPAGSDHTQTGPPRSAFALAPFGRAANLTRNKFFGQGVNNFDMVLSKITSITERLKLELRTESYNVFNRVHFNLPDNLFQDTTSFGISSSEAGRSDGTSGARQIQFAAKLRF